MKCAAVLKTCIDGAGGDLAKQCQCFLDTGKCQNAALPACQKVANGTPAPTTAEQKKAATELCVKATGCTAAQCEAAAASSSSLVASVSVVLALVSARLF
jgi:hypothetical protein